MNQIDTSHCQSCPVQPSLMCLFHPAPGIYNADGCARVAADQAGYRGQVLDHSTGVAGQRDAVTHRGIETCEHLGEIVDRVTGECRCGETRRCGRPGLERVVGYAECVACIACINVPYT